MVLEGYPSWRIDEMGFLILKAMDERCLYDFRPDCIVCGLKKFCELDTWGLKHMSGRTQAGFYAPRLMDLQRQWDTFLQTPTQYCGVAGST